MRNTLYIRIDMRYGIWGFLVWSAFCFASCEKDPYSAFSGYGKRPVYLPLTDLKNIGNLGQQPIEATGTIFLQDTLFFLLEQKKGVHVYNVSDPANTVYLTFFSIPAINDFTISGNFLYADSWKDLVTINIDDLYHIVEIERLENVFDPILYPPLYNGIFECADPDKGVIVGWEDVYLENAFCITIN